MLKPTKPLAPPVTLGVLSPLLLKPSPEGVSTIGCFIILGLFRLLDSPLRLLLSSSFVCHGVPAGTTLVLAGGGMEEKEEEESWSEDPKLAFALRSDRSEI